MSRTYKLSGRNGSARQPFQNHVPGADLAPDIRSQKMAEETNIEWTMRTFNLYSSSSRSSSAASANFFDLDGLFSSFSNSF